MTWERMVTVFIVALLFLPIPFARVQVQPQMSTLLERPILPWSRFHIRYLSYPQGIPMEETYQFTWKGMIRRETDPAGAPQRQVSFAIPPVSEPLMRWQDNPDLRLGELFTRGEVLAVRSSWQPLIFYPIRMAWQTRSQ
ncbi:MAG TPA: hypothetical protein DCE18_06620 [Syntrophobacteraceae bacterium]|nr:hypothetical protein [Syntrophobacteraceae bacterium]